MKLLMTMQALDLDDPVLSAYHEWAKAIAANVEALTVVCLKKGRYDLPANVRVYSLGKEGGRKTRAAYAARFLRLAWQLRHEYDAIFVHMNQEYLLIAGWLWKLLGKRMYLWRNHYAGSFLTRIAVMFCTKTFCTSTHSYIATYKKNVIMPVGVDLTRFDTVPSVARVPRSILFFSRIAPSKRADIFIDALALLKGKGVLFSATLCGSPLPEDEGYAASLKEKAQKSGLSELTFIPGIPNSEAPELYAQHDLFINCSPSGMLDKTIFEAAASGCIIIAASDDWNRRNAEEPFADAAGLAARIASTLALSSSGAETVRARGTAVAEREGLVALATQLVQEMKL